jgi:uncharacterized protein (DUF2062 family)
MVNTKIMKRASAAFSRLSTTLKAKLGSINADPRQVSMGYALGVFLASTPFVGIKVFIAILFTSLFKWSKVSAVLGVFHVNLFTAPFFYGLAYLVGRTVLGNGVEFEWPENASMIAFFELFRDNFSIFYSLLAGGAILGTPLAVGAYYLARMVVMHKKYY